MIARTGLAVVLAFVAGSIPFGALFARLRGIDLQKTGSGNIGATNAARALGKPLGVLVLLCDAGKAYLPILLFRELAPGDEWGEAAVGLAAVLGHVFSPWLRFRGGKGVATSLGVFLALRPLAAAFAVALWLLVYAVTRLSSLGSLTAALGMLLFLLIRQAPTAELVLVSALLVLIVFTHRDNIRRLYGRRESRSDSANPVALIAAYVHRVGNAGRWPGLPRLSPFGLESPCDGRLDHTAGAERNWLRAPVSSRNGTQMIA